MYPKRLSVSSCAHTIGVVQSLAITTIDGWKSSPEWSRIQRRRTVEVTRSVVGFIGLCSESPRAEHATTVDNIRLDEPAPSNFAFQFQCVKHDTQHAALEVGVSGVFSFDAELRQGKEMLNALDDLVDVVIHMLSWSKELGEDWLSVEGYSITECPPTNPTPAGWLLDKVRSASDIAETSSPRVERCSARFYRQSLRTTPSP